MFDSMFVASKYGQNKVIGLDVIELKVCKTVFLKGHIFGDWVVHQIVALDWQNCYQNR